MTFHVFMVIQKIPMCLNNTRHTLESATKYSWLKASLKFRWYNTFPKIQSLFNFIIHLVGLEIQMQKLTILKITFAHYFLHYSQIWLDHFICRGKKYPFNWETCLSFRLEWYQIERIWASHQEDTASGSVYTCICSEKKISHCSWNVSQLYN